MELPVKTSVGNRLRIFHGYNLVINENSSLGHDVILRQGVTIGNAIPGGGCPDIGDRVEFGVNSTVIGDISIGNDVKIGAGTVVTKSVESGCVVVGSENRKWKIKKEDIHE